MFILCNGCPDLLFSLFGGREWKLHALIQSRMTDAHSPSSTAPDFIAAIYTTMGIEQFIQLMWGVREGIILPLVLYCNILILPLSDFLEGIFHSPSRT